MSDSFKIYEKKLLGTTDYSRTSFVEKVDSKGNLQCICKTVKGMKPALLQIVLKEIQDLRSRKLQNVSQVLEALPDKENLLVFSKF